MAAEVVRCVGRTSESREVATGTRRFRLMALAAVNQTKHRPISRMLDQMRTSGSTRRRESHRKPSEQFSAFLLAKEHLLETWTGIKGEREGMPRGRGRAKTTRTGSTDNSKVLETGSRGSNSPTGTCTIAAVPAKWLWQARTREACSLR